MTLAGYDLYTSEAFTILSIFNSMQVGVLCLSLALSPLHLSTVSPPPPPLSLLSPSHSCHLVFSSLFSYLIYAASVGSFMNRSSKLTEIRLKLKCYNYLHWFHWIVPSLYTMSPIGKAFTTRSPIGWAFKTLSLIRPSIGPSIGPAFQIMSPIGHAFRTMSLISPAFRYRLHLVELLKHRLQLV